MVIGWRRSYPMRMIAAELMGSLKHVDYCTLGAKSVLGGRKAFESIFMRALLWLPDLSGHQGAPVFVEWPRDGT